MRELLQPAAKERQGERTDLKPKEPDIPADLRERESAAQEAQRREARQREVAAQAAKAVGASPRAVEQAARVAKVA